MNHNTERERGEPGPSSVSYGSGYENCAAQQTLNHLRSTKSFEQNLEEL